MSVCTNVLKSMEDCPFCGSCHKITIQKDDYFVVECLDCQCQSPPAFDEKECVKLWNNRVLPEESY